ncbi:MAG: T9SS type A sorting domain-containing protein, partial [Flavobacteriales bacterium]
WNGTGSLGTGSGAAGAPTGNIASGQGFKVRALNGSAVLNFNNAMRNGSNSQFFRAANTDSRLWLSVQGNNHFNQILIGILEDATDEEDRLYDALKFRGNGNIALSSRAANRDYAILAFPPPEQEKVIPLNVFVANAGTYTFKADVMENFEANDVVFVDAELGEFIPLDEETEITISVVEGETNNRFYLNFYPNLSVGVDGYQNTEISAFVWDGLLHVRSNDAGNQGTIDLLDMSGRLVLTQPSGNEENTIISLDGISAGTYVVKVTTQNQVMAKKILVK